jgi:hypothetical protein
MVAGSTPRLIDDRESWSEWQDLNLRQPIDIPATRSDELTEQVRWVTRGNAHVLTTNIRSEHPRLCERARYGMSRGGPGH